MSVSARIKPSQTTGRANDITPRPDAGTRILMLNKLSYSVTFPTTGRTLTGEFELKPGFVAPDQKWT